MPKFKNIVSLFVKEIFQDFEGGVKIHGRERFKWDFLIKIHNIMKKNYICKPEILMLYKKYDLKPIKRVFLLVKLCFLVLFRKFKTCY